MQFFNLFIINKIGTYKTFVTELKLHFQISNFTQDFQLLLIAFQSKKNISILQICFFLHQKASSIWLSRRFRTNLNSDRCDGNNRWINEPLIYIYLQISFIYKLVAVCTVTQAHAVCTNKKEATWQEVYHVKPFSFFFFFFNESLQAVDVHKVLLHKIAQRKLFWCLLL